jgi:hypothetical protein
MDSEQCVRMEFGPMYRGTSSPWEILCTAHPGMTGEEISALAASAGVADGPAAKYRDEIDIWRES